MLQEPGFEVTGTCWSSGYETPRSDPSGLSLSSLQPWLTRVRARANIRSMQQEPPTPTCRPILPRHPHWGEFLERLAGPDACNFTADRWTCFGDVRYTKRILRDMGQDELSIEVSTAYFRDHGGYCDCEVIFNIDHAP